jgi:PKD repeat protein
VNFKDTSTGQPTSWLREFGDKTTSNEQNPSHVYSKEGYYTISLTVRNAAGSNIITKRNYIHVGPVFPDAKFTATPTSGKRPLKVKFTDQSTGYPTSWIWEFGDKSKSTSQNPIHKYTSAGSHTVTLTIKNSAGSSTVTYKYFITVYK